MKTVVKRRGHTETYDERKLYGSIYAACVSLRMPQAEAELVAAQVCQDVGRWLDNKHEVTSADIFREASKHLCVYNSEACYMYRHFRSLS